MPMLKGYYLFIFGITCFILLNIFWEIKLNSLIPNLIFIFCSIIGILNWNNKINIKDIFNELY